MSAHNQIRPQAHAAFGTGGHETSLALAQVEVRRFLIDRGADADALARATGGLPSCWVQCGALTRVDSKWRPMSSEEVAICEKRFDGPWK
jgi:hypothetical protein